MSDKEKPEVYPASEAQPEVTQEEIVEILKKVDRESTARKLMGVDHCIVRNLENLGSKLNYTLYKL